MSSIKITKGIKNSILKHLFGSKALRRNLTDPDCNDYLANCCNCCGDGICCDYSCDCYPGTIYVEIIVIEADNIFCDTFYTYEYAGYWPALISGGFCDETGITWTGTISSGVAGTLVCTESGFTFNSECDPLNDHPVEVTSCCPFRATCTAELTNFFGACCEGTVQFNFYAEWSCEEEECERDPWPEYLFVTYDLTGTCCVPSPFVTPDGPVFGGPSGSWGFPFSGLFPGGPVWEHDTDGIFTCTIDGIEYDTQFDHGLTIVTCSGTPSASAGGIITGATELVLESCDPLLITGTIRVHAGELCEDEITITLTITE